MRPPGTFLFSVHSAERNGPPIVLLHFLRWLHANTPVEIETVVWQPGPLVAEFQRFGPVHDATALDDDQLASALAEIDDLALVYVNCVAARRILAVLDRPVPVLTYVHELALELGALDVDGGLLRRRTDHFVAGAVAIRDQLVDHGVEPEEITTIHEFIAVDDTSSPPEEVGRVRESLAIPAGSPVVGACGVAGWRKAPDLFLQVATLAGGRRSDLHFVWIGSGDDGLLDRVRADARAVGLADRFHLVPTQADLRPWYALFDVFALTSREDAFPLVCLEAAAHGRPVVCFDTGGMRELLLPDAGRVVDYPDVEAFAAEVLALVDDADLRHRIGDRGAARVRREHDVRVGAPILYRELCRVAGG